jgi:hypothetical protein
MKTESNQPSSTNASDTSFPMIPPDEHNFEDDREVPLTSTDINIARLICQLEDEGDANSDSHALDLRRKLELRGTLRGVTKLKKLMAKSEAAKKRAAKTGKLPDRFIELWVGTRGCFITLNERRTGAAFNVFILSRSGQWTRVGSDGDDHHGNDDAADSRAQWLAYELGIAYLGERCRQACKPNSRL